MMSVHPATSSPIEFRVTVAFCNVILSVSVPAAIAISQTIFIIDDLVVDISLCPEYRSCVQE
jgi:hypothetical protein